MISVYDYYPSKPSLPRFQRLLNLRTDQKQAAHLFASLLFTILCGTTVIYPLSGLPPSAQMAVDCLHHQKVDIITLIPPFAEEMGRNRDVLEFLSHRIKTVMWAGGDVSLQTGNTISSKLNLFTSCGSTETGLWPILRSSGPWHSDRWKFMKFHEAMNMKFEERSQGIFQGYIVRNPQNEYQQPVFKIFPTLQKYDTGDLFAPHWRDPQFWQYYGRADDMQVFSSGEMYHPTSVEQLITGHPDVQDALLVGSRRSQAALLLEMEESKACEPAKREKMIEHLWPTINQANQICPAYAKITKQHVVFTNPEKPMARSAKGTVQRQITVLLYEKELDELFGTTQA